MWPIVCSANVAYVRPMWPHSRWRSHWPKRVGQCGLSHSRPMWPTLGQCGHSPLEVALANQGRPKWPNVTPMWPTMIRPMWPNLGQCGHSPAAIMVRRSGWSAVSEVVDCWIDAHSGHPTFGLWINVSFFAPRMPQQYKVPEWPCASLMYACACGYVGHSCNNP
jgi:hypothetical protein